MDQQRGGPLAPPRGTLIRGHRAGTVPVALERGHGLRLPVRTALLRLVWEPHHACSRRGVGHAVDQDRSAGEPARAIGVRHHRILCVELDARDLVHADAVARACGERVHVHHPPHAAHRAGHRSCADTHEAWPPRHKRVLEHPHEVALDPPQGRGLAADSHDHVAARAVGLVLEAQDDGIARSGDRGVAAFLGGPRDPSHARGPAGGQHLHWVARLHAAPRHGARESSEVEVGAKHALHWQAQGSLGIEPRDRKRLEQLEHRHAAVPGGVRAAVHHVVAFACADGDGDRVRDPQLPAERLELRLDRAEASLAPVDKIHLVHGRHHMADAEQARDEGVPARLGRHAVARIDQRDGEVAVARACGHVARVLLVAGAVGDDEAAPRGREVAPGHVDRDALLALGLEAIDHKRKVEASAGGAVRAAVALERGEVVLMDAARVMQQPPDERALAVVDASAGDEAQQLLRLVALHVLADCLALPQRGGRHQKYPSRFFSSMLPDWSWSISRP